jgi:hypothetical protein
MGKTFLALPHRDRPYCRTFVPAVRPDLGLHGFGLKLSALGNPHIRDNLERSDSMAWSFGAWKEGREPNWFCWVVR